MWRQGRTNASERVRGERGRIEVGQRRGVLERATGSGWFGVGSIMAESVAVGGFDEEVSTDSVWWCQVKGIDLKVVGVGSRRRRSMPKRVDTAAFPSAAGATCSRAIVAPNVQAFHRWIHCTLPVSLVSF